MSYPVPELIKKLPSLMHVLLFSPPILFIVKLVKTASYRRVCINVGVLYHCTMQPFPVVPGLASALEFNYV